MSWNWHAPRLPRFFSDVLMLCCPLLVIFFLAVSHAQVLTTITPDGTLGTVVTQDGTVFDITGGTRPGDGANLFHSFDRFNVGSGDTAHFVGQQGIENIIGRVTGTGESMVDGRLQSDANLFLLNPSGFMFGANAVLDVNGSFHVSTAEVLQFADGSEFSTRLSEKSTLTVATPSAFGFLRENPAGIAIRGSSLHVPEGETLAISGGDIEIRGGRLSVPRGQLNIASIASRGEISVNLSEFNIDTVERLGDIDIVQGTRLSASGDVGGTVVIRGGRLTVDGSRIFANTQGDFDSAQLGIDIEVARDAVLKNGSWITADSEGAGNAGDIHVTADNLHMDDALIASGAFGDGDAGNIRVEVGILSLTDGARIDGSTFQFSVGVAGNITVSASTVRLGESALISSTTLGEGSAGEILLDVAHLNLTDGARITSNSVGPGHAGTVVIKATNVTVSGGAQISTLTSGAGRGGDVIITALGTLTVTGTGPDGRQSLITANAQGRGANAGNAGTVVVTASTVNISDRAQISSGTFGSGQGGSVTVNATNELIFTGAAGIFTTAQGQGVDAGNAGTVDITARSMIMNDGAQIGGGTTGPGDGSDVMVTVSEKLTLTGTGADGKPTLITASAQGAEAGDAGTVVVTVQTVTISNGAQIGSSTLAPGQAGRVLVKATDSVNLMGTSPDGAVPSGIFSQAIEGAGDAGPIVVEAANVTISGGAQIGSDTFGSGNGASVVVRATDTVTVSGKTFDGTFPSGIGAAALGQGEGAGDAGPIVVEAANVIITGGAEITSRTTGPGRGNRVTITATNALMISGSESIVSTNTADTGIGGDIVLKAHTIQLNEGAVISAESTGVGNAGNIYIREAEMLLLHANSAVKTSATQANGGNITLESQVISLTESSLTAEAMGALQMGSDGGNVTIRAQQVALNRSRVQANAFGGDGGDISIEAAEVFLADPVTCLNGECLDASSELGVSGTVDVQAPVSNLSGIVTSLPQDFRQASQLAQRCAERWREGTTSSLVMARRTDVPMSPSGVVPKAFYWMGEEAIDSSGRGAEPKEVTASGTDSYRLSSHGYTPLKFTQMLYKVECAK